VLAAVGPVVAVEVGGTAGAFDDGAWVGAFVGGFDGGRLVGLDDGLLLE
jgi:hypothetical protein